MRLRGAFSSPVMAGALMMLIAAQPGPAAAGGLEFSLRHEYYTVSGATPGEIFLDIRRQRRHMRSAHDVRSFSVARTSTRMRFRVRSRYRSGQCRISDLRMKLKFVVTLPRLADETRLDAETRALWRRFLKEVMAHENEHVRIWKDCVRRLHARLSTLSARDCKALKSRFKRAFRAGRERCRDLNTAFDEHTRQARRNEPFLRAAIAQLRQRGK